MSLRWTPDNLLRHTAKHYLGTPEEGWRTLGLAPPEAWDTWRAEALAARCKLAKGHPEGCGEAGRCGAVHAEASAPYRSGADADWAFAESRDLIVRYRDESGQPGLCGTGPRGVFVVVVERGGGERVAKSAFRPMAEPRTGPDAVLGAVRRMRNHAKQGTGGRSVGELLDLETQLLRRCAAPGHRHAQLAAELRGAS